MCVEGSSGAITCSGDFGWASDRRGELLGGGRGGRGPVLRRCALRGTASRQSLPRLSSFDAFIREETSLKRKAAPERIPYMVSLHYPGGGSLRHLCGGTLVSPNMVLTAAHCLDEKYGGHRLPLVRAWHGHEQGYKDIPVIRTGSSGWERDVLKGGDAALLVLARPVPGAKAPALLPYRLSDRHDKLRAPHCRRMGSGQRHRGSHAGRDRDVAQEKLHIRVRGPAAHCHWRLPGPF